MSDRPGIEPTRDANLRIAAALLARSRSSATHAGSLSWMPGIVPDYPASIVCNKEGATELMLEVTSLCRLASKNFTVIFASQGKLNLAA